MLQVALLTKAPVVTSGHDLFYGSAVPSRRSIYDRFIPLGSSKMVGILENCFGDSSFLVEKSFFLKMGGFTEDYGIGFEDYEFLAKVALRGYEIEALSEPLHYYRQHSGSMSHTTDMKANQVRYLRAFVEMQPWADNIQQNLLQKAQHLFFQRGIFLD